MSRHPDGAVARPKHVTVRLSEDEDAQLEAKRGSDTRSDWIRGLIHDAPTREETS